MTLSYLECLRLEWPKTLFTFMSRYQFDLYQMRKECRERFSSTQSEKCTTCGKHIQMNLGKHVALYHMELAQLWRCPLSWCTVWKGTAQDCVDHMRRAHDIPPLVKVANLARCSTCIEFLTAREPMRLSVVLTCDGCDDVSRRVRCGVIT